MRSWCPVVWSGPGWWSSRWPLWTVPISTSCFVFRSISLLLASCHLSLKWCEMKQAWSSFILHPSPLLPLFLFHVRWSVPFPACHISLPVALFSSSILSSSLLHPFLPPPMCMHLLSLDSVASSPLSYCPSPPSHLPHLSTPLSILSFLLALFLTSSHLLCSPDHLISLLPLFHNSITSLPTSQGHSLSCTIPCCCSVFLLAFLSIQPAWISFPWALVFLSCFPSTYLLSLPFSSVFCCQLLRPFIPSSCPTSSSLVITMTCLPSLGMSVLFPPFFPSPPFSLSQSLSSQTGSPLPCPCPRWWQQWQSWLWSARWWLRYFFVIGLRGRGGYEWILEDISHIFQISRYVEECIVINSCKLIQVAHFYIICKCVKGQMILVTHFCKYYKCAMGHNNTHCTFLYNL